jgi:hypothetical protein
MCSLWPACGNMTKLIKLTDVKCSLDPLVRIGVTRLPRNSVDDPIKEIEGPIIDANCKHVCHECVSFLRKKGDATYGFGQWTLGWKCSKGIV